MRTLMPSSIHLFFNFLERYRKIVLELITNKFNIGSLYCPTTEAYTYTLL